MMKGCMATASTAAAGIIFQRGSRSSSVCRGLLVRTTAIKSAGVRITASCKTRVTRAKPSKPAGGATAERKMKLRTRISTPQNSPSAAEGVGPRSRIRCRSQRPTANRSLSRKITDSVLNCSTAQRTASQQAAIVTANTTGRYCKAWR